MVRCAQCHASIPIPVELEARTMQCQYCGAVQGVPDAAARERALWERQRAEAEAQQRQLDAQHRAEEARRAARRDREERAERKRSVRWGLVTTLLSVLVAPAIISVTVFDLPARLGFGADGSDRLGLIATQLTERGCQVVAPVAATYTSSAETRLVKAEAGTCLRIVAAGGSGHDSLKLRVFDLDGKEVAVSPESRDPQLEYCPKAAGSLRYEVVPGMLDKGRLSHMVLACEDAKASATGTAKGAAEGAAPDATEDAGSASEPAKPRPKRSRR
jgi:hypothetical protein